MKFKFKKYVYLINDLTNLLLKKEREEAEVDLEKLKHIILIVSIMLILSLALNVYFILTV